MRTVLLIISIVLTAWVNSQSAQDKILGTWLSEDKDGQVKIYKKGNEYFGKIVWVKFPNDENGQPKTDLKNPDKKLNGQPIIGMVVVKNLVYKDGEWVNGTVYDPKDGKTYTCTVWLDNGNLKLRGYWGWFFATETWTKVN